MPLRAAAGAAGDDDSASPTATDTPIATREEDVRHLHQLQPADREHVGERQPQPGLRDPDRVVAADQDAGDRADQEPADRVQVDVAGDEVAEAGDVEERGRVEDVRADDLVGAEREDEQHRQPEERPAADRGQADDEAADDADRDRGDAVAP